MKCNYHAANLPFIHPFTISKGTKTHQPSFIVELDFNGIRGYGEAPAIAYYNIPVEKMIADLEAKKPMLERYAYNEPERYWHYLHHLFPQNPFLVCALDMASWDIYGKLRRQPLYKAWGFDPTLSPQTDFTIGIDTVEKMVLKMNERDWPIYKIKLGTREDLRIMQELRRHSAAPFRVDANAGWSLGEALDLIPQLKELGVELVEQPLAKDNWEGMKELYEKSSLPLFADEACVAEADVEKCVGHFHGINIKLTKCSGVTPAQRMVTRAHQLGMKVMIGCMNESSIGSAAIANLAPSVEYIDMDGPLLLAEDLAEGLRYENGRPLLSGAPGLGIRIKEGLF